MIIFLKTLTFNFKLKRNYFSFKNVSFDYLLCLIVVIELFSLYEKFFSLNHFINFFLLIIVIL